MDRKRRKNIARGLTLLRISRPLAAVTDIRTRSGYVPVYRGNVVDDAIDDAIAMQDSASRRSLPVHNPALARLLGGPTISRGPLWLVPNR